MSFTDKSIVDLRPSMRLFRGSWFVCMQFSSKGLARPCAEPKRPEPDARPEVHFGGSPPLPK